MCVICLYLCTALANILARFFVERRGTKHTTTPFASEINPLGKSPCVYFAPVTHDI